MASPGGSVLTYVHLTAWSPIEVVAKRVLSNPNLAYPTL